MKNVRHLVGITGKARSGKDTAGSFLVRKNGFHRMAFADPLKAAMAATFGVPLEEFHDDNLKDEAHPIWQMTRRHMLQYGADGLRGQFGQDLFTRRWLNSYLPLAAQEHVVVTDVRSDAEASTIRELGGRVIRITRAEQGLNGFASLHHTEQGVNPRLIHTVINNTGTVEDLHEKIETYLRSTKL